MYQISCYYFHVKEAADDINRYAALVAEGRMEYFDEIDKHIRPAIVRQTYKYQMAAHDRQDIIQDLMEIALKNCYRFNPELGDYRHYTYRVTKFELMKIYYKRIKENSAYLVKQGDTSLTVADFQTGELGPLDIVVYEENERYLLNDEGPCSKLERRIYSDHLQGFSVKEISIKTGMEEKAVRNSLYRAKVKAGRIYGREL